MFDSIGERVTGKMEHFQVVSLGDLLDSEVSSMFIILFKDVHAQNLPMLRFFLTFAAVR